MNLCFKLSLVLFLIIRIFCHIYEEYYFGFLVTFFCVFFMLFFTVLIHGRFSFETFFLFFSSLYILTSGIDLHLYDGAKYSEATSSFVETLGLSFLVGFYLISANSRGNVATIDVAMQKACFHAFVFVFLVYLIYTYKLFGFDLFSLSRGEIYKDKSTILGVTKLLIPSLVCIILFPTTKKIRLWVYLLIVIYLFLEMFVYGDRRALLGGVLFVLFVYLNNTKLKIWQITSIGLGAVMLVVLGFIRNQSPAQWVSILTKRDWLIIFNPSNYEFGAFGRIAELMNQTGAIDVHTISFLSSVQNLVPGALYPNRPLGPSQWFAATYFPEIWNKGGAFGYNFIIEVYQNFSLIGPLVIGMLISVTYRVIYQLNNTWKIIFLVTFFNSTIFLMRLDAAGWYKAFVYILSTLALVKLYQLVLNYFDGSIVNYKERH